MMIDLIQPIGCGNAVRLIVRPEHDVVRWRVLRKESNSFLGHDDPSAFLVYDGAEIFLTDARHLVNGVLYFYAVYGCADDGVWESAPAIGSATPNATFDDISPDAQELVREKVEATLNGMVQRGHLALGVASVPVMSIPFYTQGGSLPVVTVIFASGSSSARAIGEIVGDDVFDDPTWFGTQGWIENVTLEISAWSLNASERNILRRGIQASIAANLEVFESLGLHTVEVQGVSDSEDTSMNAPIYQTMMRLNCQVVVAVSDEDGFINSVVATNGGFV